jgi:hypothetical protein
MAGLGTPVGRAEDTPAAGRQEEATPEDPEVLQAAVAGHPSLPVAGEATPRRHPPGIVMTTIIEAKN